MSCNKTRPAGFPGGVKRKITHRHSARTRAIIYKSKRGQCP
uniref:Uncharacterized protein n=1 Tax=Caudovirales sp. ctu3532 TaxID=2827639 RepID=A0A8S5TI70_9CAUD|nr:MAG TPA: hypothetical protein [Caudovirales sp. ctu3532]